MKATYIDYNNDDIPYIPTPDSRSINVVENIKNRETLKNSIPRVSDDPVSMDTLKRELVLPQTSVPLRSPGGKVYTISVDDNGVVTSTLATPDRLVSSDDELQEAVNAGGFIKLATDIRGKGIIIPSGIDLTIDLNGHTYEVTGPTVGSTGTETNGLQLLRDSNILITNGKIESSYSGVKILIQNYSNLTLDNVIVDASHAPNVRYVCSNNNGITKYLGSTSILAPENVFAFDAYYWPKKGYESVNVIVNTTGMIQGAIELTSDGSKTEEDFRANASIKIEKGKFTYDPTSYLADPGLKVYITPDHSEYAVGLII